MEAPVCVPQNLACYRRGGRSSNDENENTHDHDRSKQRREQLTSTRTTTILITNLLTTIPLQGCDQKVCAKLWLTLLGRGRCPLVRGEVALFQM